MKEGSTYERPSHNGDIHIDDSTLQVIGEQVIAPGEWRCPPTP
jgi:hypothetical protein